MSGVTREARTLSGADIGRTITLPDGTRGRIRSVEHIPRATTVNYGWPPTRAALSPSTPVTIEGTTP